MGLTIFLPSSIWTKEGAANHIKRKSETTSASSPRPFGSQALERKKTYRAIQWHHHPVQETSKIMLVGEERWVGEQSHSLK